ncbi:fungal-specific transcription factor domain-containing protein [Dactylonectria macrodidyma]|uniref:Fungal-specific transcription factor domain-containing protein n=1 Tax=Dactylonectria macrodidyma TaxID=307937 RepID=A0A9P9F5E9_9HYPO|nr:fungal-specific transcription factor domain-containing protein [Dactylonectria macrodidyma]
MSSASLSSGDKSHVGKSKERQRVSVACLPCREKRIRCDGALPQCQSCAGRGVACEYNFTENKRKPPSKVYVKALEERIRVLEQRLSAKENAAITRNPHHGEESAVSMRFDDANESEGCDLLSAVTGLLGRLAIADDGQLHYFGSQSNYHLLNNGSGYATMESTVCMQQQGLATVEALGKNTPLSTELQEHLLDLYWTWQNPSNYIVHKGAFSIAYNSRTYGTYCTPSLLSAMFALASRFSDCPELRTIPDDPHTAGYAFFEQAKLLLLYESHAPTVATVQAAALMAIRAMSDNQEALGWLYCGNAARMALNLGLNMDCSPWVTSGIINEDQAEVRKVTWWGCYSLDKLFSIALGRPGCTRKSQYTCAKPSLAHDAEFDTWPSTPEPGEDISPSAMQSRTVSTSHSTSQCLSIASEAMDKIYAPNSGLSKREIEDIVAETDVELRAYYTNLPSHLRLPSSLRTAVPAHIYLLQQRFTAMVTVHIAFTAAIIHLINATPGSHSFEQQAIRDLTTCIEALEEMKATWWAWSSKALQTILGLAEDWYIPDAVKLISKDC